MDLFKVAVFDIETSNLNADFGIVLCGVIYDITNDKMYIYRWDETNDFKEGKYSSDREVVVKIRDCLESFDIIVGYNSQRFDIPFLRTRLLNHQERMIDSVRHIDLYYYVKFKLKLHDFKLDTLAKFSKTNSQKTEVDGLKWVEALVYAGTKKGRQAMNYIVEHCVLDCKVLAEAFGKVKDLIGNIKYR